MHNTLIWNENEGSRSLHEILSLESLRSKERNRRSTVSDEDHNSLGTDLKGIETLILPDVSHTIDLNSFSYFLCPQNKFQVILLEVPTPKIFRRSNPHCSRLRNSCYSYEIL